MIVQNLYKNFIYVVPKILLSFIQEEKLLKWKLQNGKSMLSNFWNFWILIDILKIDYGWILIRFFERKLYSDGVSHHLLQFFKEYTRQHDKFETLCRIEREPYLIPAFIMIVKVVISLILRLFQNFSCHRESDLSCWSSAPRFVVNNRER